MDQTSSRFTTISTEALFIRERIAARVTLLNITIFIPMWRGQQWNHYDRKILSNLIHIESFARSEWIEDIQPDIDFKGKILREENSKTMNCEKDVVAATSRNFRVKVETASARWNAAISKTFSSIRLDRVVERRNCFLVDRFNIDVLTFPRLKWIWIYRFIV